MTPEQVELVQKTYEKIRPNANQFAELFYSHLFATQPDLQHLFRGDMRTQGTMFMTALGLVVNNLGNPDAIRSAIQDLGQRHAGYGVMQPYFPVAGSALLSTLEQMLGDEFTPEVRAAWGEAFALLANPMKEAMRDQHPRGS